MCFYVKFSGAHVSLWMKSEALDGSTSSIAEDVGRQGSFEVTHFHVQKSKSAFLLTANGKYTAPEHIFKIVYCKKVFQEIAK